MKSINRENIEKQINRNNNVESFATVLYIWAKPGIFCRWSGEKAIIAPGIRVGKSSLGLEYADGNCEPPISTIMSMRYYMNSFDHYCLTLKNIAF